MRVIARITITTVLAVFCGFGASLASAGEKVVLFNGKNLDGWKTFVSDKKTPASKVWTIEDGIITCTGKPAGYLRTEKEFENYHLVVEWRFKEGTPGGNSGVLLHTVGDDMIWPKSIEAQLMSKNAGDIWLIGGATLDVENAKERTNGRRTVKLKADGHYEKPIGEWNRYDILCKGGDITLKVNGEVANQGSNASLTKGAICLQSEGAEIHFRTIELTELD